MCVATVGIIAGLANSHMIHAARDIRFLIPVGLYFLAASVGTVMRAKLAAMLLSVPLAVAGVVVVIASIMHGPAVAIVMNLLVSAPLLCTPAFVLYRNRGCLR